MHSTLVQLAVQRASRDCRRCRLADSRRKRRRRRPHDRSKPRKAGAAVSRSHSSAGGHGARARVPRSLAVAPDGQVSQRKSMLQLVFSVRRSSRRFASTVVAGAAIVSGFTSMNRSYAADTSPTLVVPAGKGDMVKLPGPAVAVFVADPDVADVHVPTPETVFVLGKKAGTTTLFALGANNRTILRKTIEVSADTQSVQRMLDARFPQLRLTLTSAPGSTMIAGRVSSAADADAVIQSLKPYLRDKETLVNRLTLDHPIQVNLRVRVTEVD